MKKLLLFAATVTMFAACTTDNTEDVAVLPDGILQVSFSDDDSRVQLDENSRTVWNEGDMISVFNKTNGNECWQFDGKTGDKRGTLSKISGNAGTTSTDKVVALYPYDSNCIVSGNMISTTIPATQTYKVDSFGKGGNIMVAVSNDNELQFKHIFGWIKLSLTDDHNRKVSHIILNGNNGEKLSGNVFIDTNSQKVYGNTSTVTLDCGNGVQLSKTDPTYFYIAVVPQTFTNGVSVKINMTDGTSLEKNYEKPFTVTRNHIQPIKASNFQSICNKIFYTTTDDKPITMEKTVGFGANVISNTYKGVRGIIQFDGNITSIPERAFYECRNLTSVIIPNGVTSIGDSAFYYCDFLTNITIPDSVTSIGDSAFYYCSRLRSITIPDSVTSIGYDAFQTWSGSLTSVYITDIAKWCAIKFDSYNSNPLARAHNLYLNGELVTDLIIPDSVTEIGGYAFCGCSSLTSINIPDGVTSIGEHAFRDCSNLESVYITDIAKWCAIKFDSATSNPLCPANNLYLNGELVEDLVIPDSVTSIGDYAFYGPFGLSSVTIGNNVTSIGNFAFANCDFLTNITIPDSVTSIGYYAFRECSRLTSVTIGNNVTSIGDYAFQECRNLTNVTIGNSVTQIGQCAFQYCNSLASVTIPNSVTSIGYDAFEGCSSLTNVTIGNSVTSIGNSAFYGCNSLTNVTIGNSVTSIGQYAFYGCSSLNSITIPDSVTSIEDGAFYGCSNLLYFLGKYASSDLRCLITDGKLIAFAPFGLTEYAIPDEITSIGVQIFSDCSSLKHITIPGRVTSIGDYAFYNCSSLTSINIPDSVILIGSNAFADCSWLERVTIGSCVTSIRGSAFSGCIRLRWIYCKPTTPPTLSFNTFYDIERAIIYVPRASVDAYKSATGWSDYASMIGGYDF